jgi:hypothetical protein
MAANHLVPGLASLQLVPYLRDRVTITKIDIHRDVNSGPVAMSEWTQETPPTTVPFLELRATRGMGSVRQTWLELPGSTRGLRSHSAALTGPAPITENDSSTSLDGSTYFHCPAVLRISSCG